MLRFFITLLLVITSQLAIGQNDVSYFYKNAGGKETNIFWATHFGNDFALDLRHNFDWSNTFGIFAGKTFSHRRFNVTPAFGILQGDYNGFSSEAYFGGGTKYSFTGMLQFATCTDGSPLKDWGYQWLEAYYWLPPFLHLGIGQQAYYEFATDFSTVVDIGPTAKLRLNQWYIKPWWTYGGITEGNPNKFFLGIGRNF